MALGLGCPIGFFTGDNLRLLEDAQVLKPAYFPSVPRVLNRIYAAASAALLNGGVKGALLAKAIEVKTRNLKETGSTDHALWDALVFRKIRALLGGNTKVVTSGSAPLAAEVLDFLKIALGGAVAEGALIYSDNPFSGNPFVPFSFFSNDLAPFLLLGL